MGTHLVCQEARIGEWINRIQNRQTGDFSGLYYKKKWKREDSSLIPSTFSNTDETFFSDTFQKPRYLMTGDEKMAALTTCLDNMGLTRHEYQILFHDNFIKSCLPKIYENEWSESYESILAKYGCTKLNQEVCVICPRRFGKTVSVALFCAAFVYCIPQCTIAIFSTGKRTSGKLMALCVKFLNLLPMFKERCETCNSENVVLNFGKRDQSMLNCYPGTVAVCYFFLLKKNFIGRKKREQKNFFVIKIMDVLRDYHSVSLATIQLWVETQLEKERENTSFDYWGLAREPHKYIKLVKIPDTSHSFFDAVAVSLGEKSYHEIKKKTREFITKLLSSEDTLEEVKRKLMKAKIQKKELEFKEEDFLMDSLDLTDDPKQVLEAVEKRLDSKNRYTHNLFICQCVCEVERLEIRRFMVNETSLEIEELPTLSCCNPGVFANGPEKQINLIFYKNHVDIFKEATFTGTLMIETEESRRIKKGKPGRNKAIKTVIKQDFFTLTTDHEYLLKNQHDKIFVTNIKKNVVGLVGELFDIGYSVFERREIILGCEDSEDRWLINFKIFCMDGLEVFSSVVPEVSNLIYSIGGLDYYGEIFKQPDREIFKQQDSLKQEEYVWVVWQVDIIKEDEFYPEKMVFLSFGKSNGEPPNFRLHPVVEKGASTCLCYSTMTKIKDSDKMDICYNSNSKINDINLSKFAWEYIIPKCASNSYFY